MNAGHLLRRARDALEVRAVPVRDAGRRLAPAEAAAAWTKAYRAGRLLALPLALGVFAAGFTLDDLRVVRVPAALLGAGVAVAVLAVGPVVLARRPFQRAVRMEGAAAGLFLERTLTRRRVLAGAGVVLFAGWLVLLTNGLTPRW